MKCPAQQAHIFQKRAMYAPRHNSFRRYLHCRWHFAWRISDEWQGDGESGFIEARQSFIRGSALQHRAFRGDSFNRHRSRRQIHAQASQQAGRLANLIFDASAYERLIASAISPRGSRRRDGGKSSDGHRRRCHAHRHIYRAPSDGPCPDGHTPGMNSRRGDARLISFSLRRAMPIC